MVLQWGDGIVGHMDIMPDEYEINELISRNELLQQMEIIKKYITMLEEKVVKLNEDVEYYERRERIRGGKNVK